MGKGGKGGKEKGREGERESECERERERRERGRERPGEGGMEKRVRNRDKVRQKDESFYSFCKSPYRPYLFCYYCPYLFRCLHLLGRHVPSIPSRGDLSLAEAPRLRCLNHVA